MLQSNHQGGDNRPPQLRGIVMTIYEVSSEMDNQMVQHKAGLMARIDNAKTDEEMRACVVLLEILAPYWITLGYGYKGSELAGRVLHYLDTAGEETRQRAMALVDTFNRGHNKYMYG